MTEPARPLPPGLGNAGLVERVGANVHRPRHPNSSSVEAFLVHLASTGCTDAPRFIGITDDNRQAVSYIPGDTGIRPNIGDPELLVSVAQLQRRLHDASLAFVVPAHSTWDTQLSSPSQANLVCHNDLNVNNVVAVGTLAVGAIDFDFAAPSDPHWDLAIALRHWLPVIDPSDRHGDWADIDTAVRFTAYLDAYGLSVAHRPHVAALIGQFLDHALAAMRRNAAARKPAYVRVWESGYPDVNRRSQTWWQRQIRSLF